MYVTKLKSKTNQIIDKLKKSGNKSFKKFVVIDKTKYVAIKINKSRCKNKIRDNFQTCGISTHRRQNSKYEFKINNNFDV